MKIEKAIEILNLISYGDTLTIKYDIESAIKLGLEALKRVKLCRGSRESSWANPLPGETEE